jgi:hypothetical protein
MNGLINATLHRAGNVFRGQTLIGTIRKLQRKRSVRNTHSGLLFFISIFIYFIFCEFYSTGPRKVEMNAFF